MKVNKFKNKIILGDSLELLSEMDNNSIDVVLTDPPYFLDKLDNNWKYEKVGNTKNQQVIKSLPSGMKFDRKQGQDFYKWYLKVSEQIFRILKPGGFFFSFSSPRLYHRMASAVDDAGLEIRDCFLWLYTQNQAKAMSVNHFIDKMEIFEKEKGALKEKFAGWKTPQIKSCFEPIVMAQKPTDGTYLENIIKYNTGLVNTNIRIGDNMFPANVLAVDEINEIIDKAFLINKPGKKEKGDFNDHKTVKPLEICEYIIKLTAFYKDAIILDPFVGSGTTAVAAKNLGLNYIGIDVNPEYVKIAKARLNENPSGVFKKECDTQKNLFELLLNKSHARSCGV
ncbi:MAG: site-specific DNA-methyltransferase [bacterium]